MSSRRCTAKRSDGEQCNSYAQHGNDFCAFHKRKYMAVTESNIKHGQKAKLSSLGITVLPEKYKEVYDDLLDADNILDLKSEVAYLKTLQVWFQNKLAKTPEINNSLFLQVKDLISLFMSEEGLDTDMATIFTDKLILKIWPIIEKEIPKYDLTDKNIHLIKDLILATSKVCSDMKKIQDGYTVNVKIDSSILVSFVQNVIMECVTDGPTRQKIIERARYYNTNMLNLPTSLSNVVQQVPDKKSVGDILLNATGDLQEDNDE